MCFPPCSHSQVCTVIDGKGKADHKSQFEAPSRTKTLFPPLDPWVASRCPDFERDQRRACELTRKKCIAPGQTAPHRWPREGSAMLRSYREAKPLFRKLRWTVYHLPWEPDKRKLVKIATGSLHYSFFKVCSQWVVLDSIIVVLGGYKCFGTYPLMIQGL